MEAILIIFYIIPLIIFISNTLICSNSVDKVEIAYYSILLGMILYLTLFYYSISLSYYIKEDTIIKMENQEIKYEVTSIEPNTNKILTIKLINE